MIFTPLRKAAIAGAGMLAIGTAGGVAVHAATSASPSSAPTAATASPSPGTGNGRQCAPAPLLGAARQVLSIAASVTGQSQQQILDQLREGRTLDQIAGAKAQTIEQQALAKLKTRLDKAVSDGKLSSSRETSMLDKAKSALEKAMSSDLSKDIPASGSMPKACGRNLGRNGLLATLVKVTAQKTGLTQQQVLQDLRNGQSIDQIAGSKAADIKATVLQMEEQRLSGMLDKLMSHSGGFGGPGNGNHGRGMGRFGGLFDGSGATPAA